MIFFLTIFGLHCFFFVPLCPSGTTHLFNHPFHEQKTSLVVLQIVVPLYNVCITYIYCFCIIPCHDNQCHSSVWESAVAKSDTFNFYLKLF